MNIHDVTLWAVTDVTLLTTNYLRCYRPRYKLTSDRYIVEVQQLRVLH